MEPLSLIFFRHAKSDWHADYGADDSRRPLSRRGRRASRAMGRFLTKAGQVPVLAVTSPAVRARSTLELAMRAGDWDCSVQVRSRLYGGAADLLEEIRGMPNEARAVLFVGHEPACSTVAELLTGASEIGLPTAAMLRLDLKVDQWREIELRCAQISWLVLPRLLRPA